MLLRHARATLERDGFVLLPRTMKWLAALPPTVRPIELGRRHAMVANFLCAYWPRPARMNRYMDELIADAPHKLRLLSSDVMHELFVLRLYYDVITPPPCGR